MSTCGWCGKTVDWARYGEFHYDGVCVAGPAAKGRADRILADYHHGGYGKRLLAAGLGGFTPVTRPTDG